MLPQDPFAYQQRSTPTPEEIQQHRASRIATQVWELAATIFPQLVSFELAFDKHNNKDGEDWKPPATLPDFEKVAADAMNRSLICAWRAVEHALAVSGESQERAMKLAEKFPVPEDS